MIVAWVKAGMERAKADDAAGKDRRDAQGRQKLAIGRPRVAGDVEETIRLQLAGKTRILKIAKGLGVGVGTVQRTAKAAADRQVAS